MSEMARRLKERRAKSEQTVSIPDPCIVIVLPSYLQDDGGEKNKGWNNGGAAQTNGSGNGNKTGPPTPPVNGPESPRLGRRYQSVLFSWPLLAVSWCLCTFTVVHSAACSSFTSVVECACIGCMLCIQLILIYLISVCFYFCARKFILN
jgi:hypothetical protein